MTTADDPWAGVTAARLPAAGLACLAPVRDRPGVRAHVADGVAWVTWPAGERGVIECLRPAAGAAFFARRGADWFRFGSRVPTSERPPDGPGRPLDAALVPSPVAPLAPPAGAVEPLRITLVHGGPVRPAAALRCRVADLLPWADTALTAELAAVRAARLGDVAVLRGGRLPVVPGATRFWGETVLIPLGFRPDPDLPSAVLRAAAGVADDELLILDAAGAEAIPEAAFAPLTRAGIRMAAQ